jgi:hypothetical protein
VAHSAPLAIGADRTAADLPTPRCSVPSWPPGDALPLGEDRVLRVIDTRLDEGTDGDPVSVLVVVPVRPGDSTSDRIQ